MLGARMTAIITDPYKLVGARIADKYTIEAVIDRGGYGLVYRAFHEILGVPVALKFYTGLSQAPPDKQQELYDRFAQEGGLLSSLSTRSASIVQARDIGTLVTENGIKMPYLVLEWLEGESLERLLHNKESPARGRKHSWMEAFYLLDGVARALAVAHAANVAHRDIKPGNFFVLGNDLSSGVMLKLLDFGIAKVMPADKGVTQGALSEFTPMYGAPEQFDRQHGATGPWTDVYGFSLVMLEVLRGGQRVFGGKEFMALAIACQDPSNRPTPRALGIETSDAVEAVFAKALAVKVADRYEHMAAFWNALGAALEVRDFMAVVADGRGVGVEARAGASLRGRVADVSLRAPALAAAGVSASGSGLGGSSGSGSRSSALRDLPPSTSGSGPATGDGADIFTRSAPPSRAQGRRTGLVVGGVVVGLVVVAAVVAVVMLPGRGGPAEPAAGLPAAGAMVAGTAATVETPVVTASPASRCPEGMAFIAGGKFFMGSDSVDSPALMRFSRPAHQQTIGDFCMDLREVTAGEYAACSDKGECKRAFRDAFWPMGKSEKKKAWEESRAAYSVLCNDGQAGRESHPANCVTWEQADEYCRNHGKRLPREAEWEFAARGSDGRRFPWGDDPPGPRQLNGCGTECVAWRATVKLPEQNPLYEVDDGHFGTAPVGSFPAGKTQAGLLDMVGNVFEWTADDFKVYPDAPADTMTPPEGAKVMRGGAFNSTSADHAEPALRFPQDATAHIHAVGFRCAAEPK